MPQFVLQPYSDEKFVDRDAEANLIKGILQQLVESVGKISRTRAILFRGERGFGKTWLCMHLHRTVLKAFPVKSLYLALFPLPAEYREDLQSEEWVIPEKPQHEETCNQLMRWVCDRLQIPYPKDPTTIEIQRALVGGVEDKFKQSHFLVLILDSVFEADWNLLEVIERDLLAPLAELPNVLFIMTGRGKPYPWISPALRMGMQEKSLGVLTPEDIEKLKNKQAPSARMGAEKLYELGGGSPLVSSLLLQVDDPIQALDDVADYLLEVVPPGLNRRRLRDVFESLCVLDEFREGEMEVMLNAYYRARSASRPLVSVRDVRDELSRTYLFRWEGSGFRVDESLRTVLRGYLKHRQLELWKQLNCAAYKIYAEFARNYAQYKDEYEKLAKPYKDALESAHVWTECEKTVQQTVNTLGGENHGN